jgi:hypothetical protein
MWQYQDFLRDQERSINSQTNPGFKQSFAVSISETSASRIASAFSIDKDDCGFGMSPMNPLSPER